MSGPYSQPQDFHAPVGRSRGVTLSSRRPVSNGVGRRANQGEGWGRVWSVHISFQESFYSFKELSGNSLRITTLGSKVQTTNPPNCLFSISKDTQQWIFKTYANNKKRFLLCFMWFTHLSSSLLTFLNYHGFQVQSQISLTLQHLIQCTVKIR